MGFHHTSVLLAESIDGLRIRQSGTYVDGTLGGGGHAEAICQQLSGEGRLIGFDRDSDACKAAKERLEPFKERVTILHRNYSEIAAALGELGITSVDGILLDLGVSSFQLDNTARGFTYREDAPLDMRMDRSAALSAFEVVNTYGEGELLRIIRTYGEERFAAPIARSICQKRQSGAISSTGQLAEIIKAAIPARARSEKGHPAKRTFQAIRIEVNGELDALKGTLDTMIDLLAPGGRLCVISFHSLEDRIVKECFKRNEDPCTCPPDFPVCVCGKKSKGKVITRHPITPGDQEIESNRRSKSSKLRVFERRDEQTIEETGEKRWPEHRQKEG